MRKLKPAVLLLAITTLVAITSQVAAADSNAPGLVDVVLVDRQALRDSEDGIDTVKSFLALVSTLKEGQSFAFVNADDPLEFLGPAVAGTRLFRTLEQEFESRLEPYKPRGESNLVRAFSETYNLLGDEGASRGSTVYLVTGANSGEDPTQLADRLAPIVRLFEDKGWPIVGLSLPGTSPDVRDLLSTISEGSGGESFELSVPDGFKSLSDRLLREGAQGTLAELGQGALSPNAVLTSTLSIAPGTREATLVFLREGRYGSLRLSNPSGFEASAGDRTVSKVIEASHVVIWRLIDPAPGRWTVDVRGTEGVVSSWYYVANKYSPGLESLGAVALNEPATLVAFVTDRQERVALDGVRMTANVISPDGATVVHELNDNGISGDSVAADGYFSATIPPVIAEGEYKVELELSWPGLDHRISSQGAFRAQAFPAVDVTPINTGDVQPGERTKVATIFVHVQGQPYAVSANELTPDLASNVDEAGVLEIKPKRLIDRDRDRAWEYDVFFTPEQGGLHTSVIRLNLEYAGRQYTYTSDPMVLSAIMPPAPPVPVVASEPAPPPPRPAPEIPTLQRPVEPSASFPWGQLAGYIAIGALLAAALVYWRTRTRPFGYLYNDRNERLVDFTRLQRHPIMSFVFRSHVRGNELGIPGLEGVRFSFSGRRVGLTSRGATPTVRVNNQPVVEKTPIRDRTWIGAHGRLYSILISPPAMQIDPGVADD